MQQVKVTFELIAKDIGTVFGKVFATKPYIAILNALGAIMFIDQEISDHYLEFIRNFNFTFLNVGDYSLPLGGVNLAFFRVSERAIVVIYTKMGFTGQLLAFKSRMYEWAPKIDELIGEITCPTMRSIQNAPVEPAPAIIESAPSTEKKGKGFREFPVLTRKLDGKEKFPLEVAQVLHSCDGKHSIEEICQESNIPRIKVKDILQEYQKKKWIELKRILE